MRSKQAVLVLIVVLLVTGVGTSGDSPAPVSLPKEPLRHGGLVSAIAVSADGKVLVSAGWDKMVRVWDLTTGKQLHQLEGHQAEIECVAITPDGKLVASGSWDRTIRLWDVASGKELRQLAEHPDGILSLAFSPDGKTLASGNQDRRGQKGSFHLWDVATGNGLIRFAGHATPVTAIAFAADGKSLISGGVDGRVCVCEAGTGRLLHELRGHQGWVYGVALSADGKRIASAGADKTVRLWDATTGKELRLFEGHQDKVRAVAFAPDTRTVVSGGFDRSIRLWEVSSGKERGSLVGHTAGVRTLAFFQGRTALASSGSDGTIRFHTLYAPSTDQPTKLEDKDLIALWKRLESDDAGAAYQAITTLLQASEQSLPFLAKRLEEEAKPDAKRLAQLIAELDHDQFAVREKATQELEKLGGQAEDALRTALKGNIGVEVRRRIDDLLDKLSKPSATPASQRLGRVLEVLENTDTPEARLLLKKLAEGPAGARVTREAQAILKRRPA